MSNNGSTASSDVRSASVAGRIADPGRRVPPWDASACGDDMYRNAAMQRHPTLMGLPVSTFRDSYGTPARQEAFVIGVPSGTFYGAYAKRSGGARSALDGQPAQVLTWTRNSCNFSVFFVRKAGEWVSDEAFEWGVDADF